LTLIALLVIWVIAVLFVLVILRGVALADRDAARRRAELRAEAARAEAARAEAARAERKATGEAAHDAPRRHVPMLVLVVTLGVCAAGAAADAPDASAACAGEPEDATLCLINEERRARGRPALAADPRLALAARRYSADMVARGYFAHVSPDGATLTDRLRRIGYVGGCAWRAGETLAWGFGDERTPAARVAAWMHSRRHRRVLLSTRYRDVGIGVAGGVPDGSGDGLTYTADLGRRRC
jgi:uncharacterized protein YkwD